MKLKSVTILPKHSSHTGAGQSNFRSLSVLKTLIFWILSLKQACS